MKRLMFVSFAVVSLVLGAAMVSGAGSSEDLPEPKPLERVETGTATDSLANTRCSVSMSLNPIAIGDADRIVVEIGDEGDVITRPTTWGYSGISPGANVTVYALGLDSEEPPEVLLDGHLNPECNLVRDQP